MAEQTIDLFLENRMLDGILDPVYLVNSGKKIVDANKAARDLFGDIQGLSLEKVADDKKIFDAVSNCLAGNPGKRSNIFLPTPISRHYEINVWRLPDLKTPKPAWAMVVLRDITESTKASEMRADFVSNVSHELKSPLSALLGFIETLRGPAKNDPEATSKFLGIMEAEAQRMTRIINELLSLSKLETQEHIRPKKLVSVSPILRHVSDFLSVRAKEHDMIINLEISDQLPEVFGNSDELIQVFQNLVSNAIVYGFPNTVVEVSAQSRVGEEFPEAGVAVSVINQGEKIPEAEIPRLTERFYRADKGRSRSMGGTGLGLAIVKHIVSRHRGELKIESSDQDGTIFKVWLPSIIKKKVTDSLIN